MSQDKRVFGLDLLRSAAILPVVYMHGETIVKSHFPNYGIFGWDGVTIFFVLSGFLIGRILIKTFDTPHFDFAALLNFWGRRWFRTLPAYFFILSLLIGAHFLSNGRYPVNSGIFPDHVGWYYLFAQAPASPHPWFFPEAWSLAVEEWFYLLIPLGLFATLRLTPMNFRKTLALWIVGIVAATILFRLSRVGPAGSGLASLDAWDLGLRKQVVTRLDSIMTGVAGAYFSAYHACAWRKYSRPLLWLGLLALVCDKVLVESSSTYRNYWALSLSPLATLMLLPRLSELRAPAHGFFKVFGFISAISYSMYLINLSPVNLVILAALIDWLPSAYTRDAIVYLAYWILTIGLSYLLYRGVEQPFMKLRERYAQARPAMNVGSMKGTP